ncbi:zinc finger C2HC domain-containing protein 1A isoform X1 [Hypomesus transpacificus]|uniref:zinc finger C2HC domain-containing protein 1A isoform X1 n=1 Tax=Hypomesus transpacificus TaxID=137520 RepID=UPI001F07DFDE|nr:zinc finger C2HC domain-containing protein 1A isoform X1 [Hypomesus transpacificus]
MDEYEDEDAPRAEELIPCKICDRRFFPKVLKKHTPICQKAAAKRRKVFDSSRQRAEGTDISTLKPIKSKSQSSSTARADKAEPPKKPSNWRRKHEDFIATIRAAKGLTQVLKEGGPLPPPPPPSYDPDYIQCPHCARRFSENAADRHIKFCKEQAARIANKSKSVGEPKKPATRTQYKPPAAKKVTSPAVSVSAVSNSPSSSRLPQRSTSGLPSGIPSSKVPSAGLGRSISSGYTTPPSGLTSPPSGAGVKARPVGPYGPGRNAQSGAGLNKRKVYNAEHYNSRNEADNGGTQSKFCHECGTKYPVELAKFCCECGVRRMCI